MRQVMLQRVRAAAVQQQARARAEQVFGFAQAAVDERDRGAFATGGECVLGVVREFDIGAPSGGQLRGACMQRFAHQRG